MKVGLDRLPEIPSLLTLLRSSRTGVLAHPASVNRRLSHIADVLGDVGIRPVMFFGPEHGYGGEAQDMIGVASAKDSRTGGPIVSLYGDRFEDLSPRPKDLAAIDTLLIDLADVGARYYTFVWTALLAVRAASRAGIRAILLDRPNPISGALSSVEGRTQQPGFLSFVGLMPVPIRHALTPGELVAWFAQKESIALGEHGCLQVVPVEGWNRDSYAADWDRAFVLPSPNMPTADTALVYPGGCLLEGTNLSEGRGTTRPFQIVGAPWIDGRKLAKDLEAARLPGFIPRPLTFRPTFHKHAGQVCGGVEIHVSDRRSFRPVATYLVLTALAYRQDPDRFRFRTERYEYVDDIPAFDLLTGSADARLQILAGSGVVEMAQTAAAPDPGWADAMAEARNVLLCAAVVPSDVHRDRKSSSRT